MNAMKSFVSHLRPKSETINLSKTERQLSVGAGAALLVLGLVQRSPWRAIVTAGLGAAGIYRGLSGHCHLYEAIGVRSAGPEEPVESSQGATKSGGKNQLDKDRFDKLKATQVARGRDVEKAIEVAAEEVKELRRREGRTKDEAEEIQDEFDRGKRE